MSILDVPPANGNKRTTLHPKCTHLSISTPRSMPRRRRTYKGQNSKKQTNIKTSYVCSNFRLRLHPLPVATSGIPLHTPKKYQYTQKQTTRNLIKQNEQHRIQSSNANNGCGSPGRVDRKRSPMVRRTRCKNGLQTVERRANSPCGTHDHKTKTHRSRIPAPSSQQGRRLQGE